MDLLKKHLLKYEKPLWFLIVILSFLLLRKIHELAAPITLVAIVVVGLSYSLFTTYKYRKSKLNYIVFNTYNDGYVGFEGLFFGAAVLIGCGLSLYFNYITIVWFSMGFLVSILLFLNSLYTMPSGFLKFRHDVLRLYGVTDVMEVKNIKSIEIYGNRIVIKSLNGKVWLASSLKIEEANANEIVRFLTDRLTAYPVEITHQVLDRKSEHA